MTAAEIDALKAERDDLAKRLALCIADEPTGVYQEGRRAAFAEAVAWLRARAAAADAEVDDECDGVDADRFCALASTLRGEAAALEAWVKAGCPKAAAAPVREKWSALVCALNDPATAEVAATLLDIGCYEDDVMAAYDVLSPEDRRRIKDGTEAARAVARSAGGSFGAETKAAESALREGVGMALRAMPTRAAP